MSGCMGTDKPLIAILMAVYEPRVDWLREQLLSLDAQTYPNLKLYIRDDCSPTVPFEDIQSCVQMCIHSFPYEIKQNEINLGSNKTFERLTQEADGEYFAYCDQDDIWLPEKLTMLYKTIKMQKAVLTYGDMSVIDREGHVTAESLRNVRPRLRYLQGNGLAARYAFTNCTAGCSLLVQREIARAALPFPARTVCDQWLCMTAAHAGKIAFVNRPLVQYRIHGSNQTDILLGIASKQDYLIQRVIPMIERVNEFDRRFGLPSEATAFAIAREKGELAGIWRYRSLCPKDAWFEIVLHFLPDWAVRKFFRKVGRSV